MATDIIKLSYNNNNNEFIIINSTKNIQDILINDDIIKYLTLNIVPNFKKNHDITKNTNLIEKYICIINNNPDIYINLINHEKSTFMGNIELVMKLYKNINMYENNQLRIDLETELINELDKKKNY